MWLRLIIPSPYQTTLSMARSSLNKLETILSRMNVSIDAGFYEKIKSQGTSDLFSYSTKSDPVANRLERFGKIKPINKPMNRLDELIRLTEQGKLWRFPIDNDQGLEAEKQVPFEEHVFFDSHLKDFPQLQFVQSFMQTVTSGLARNPWMSVRRKHEVIKFYKDFFEQNKHLYEDVKTARPPPDFK